LSDFMENGDGTPVAVGHGAVADEGAPWIWWIGFNAMIGIMLYFDVVASQDETTTVRQAAISSALWVSVALLFAGLLMMTWSFTDGSTFLVGYLVEKSLSVDNLLVIMLIFKSFRIRPTRQPRVLKWGIIGAIVMRAGFIFAGIELLERFEWLIYLFGALLLYAAVGMLRGEEEEDDEMEQRDSTIITILKRFVPYTTDNSTVEFFIRTHQTKALVATPMFAALLVIEASDVIFAIDSIPCILGLTQDRFLVYSSNMLAVLGLRSLYVLLEDLLHRVKHLQTGLGLVLAFVGIKMMAGDWVEISQLQSLGIIIGILTVTIVAGGMVDNKGGVDHKRLSDVL